jgi:hypothetical protein|tara:strand:+ start:2485 stop:2904 length:420 start_codon:yes stop_codon:yes gene_type:complete
MASVSGWTEGILISLLFLTVFGIVIAGMNIQYGENYNLGLTDNSTEQLFIEYQDTAETQIKGGDVEFDAQQGITLKESYALTKDLINIIWTFLSGGFIEDLVSLLNLGTAGTALAVTLRILWFLSLVFALLYALFKVAF